MAIKPRTALSEPAAFENECVGFFAEIVQLFGVPKSVGQIYGLLYASPEPLGFAEILERLDMSKGSVSQGLQLLRSLGAVIEMARPPEISNHGSGAQLATRASRSVAYAPELSLRQLVTGVLRERIAPMASTGGDRLKRLKDLAGRSSEHAEFYSERVRQLTIWSRRFTTVLPLLTALLGPKKKAR